MKSKFINVLAVTSITLLLVLTQQIFAVGTPAGTVIQSRSKVVYTSASGATVDTVYSNTVDFTVAQIAAVNISPATNAQVTTRDSLYVDYALSVTNSGNGTDQFSLSGTSSKGWSIAFYFDSNGDEVLQEGEISSGSISQTGTIAADASYKFFARIFVPRDPSLNGQTDTASIAAISVFDAEKENSAEARTTVNTVNFSNVATGLTVTPTNPSPGENVTYSITLQNNGSATATNVTIEDLVNAGQFTFVSANTSVGSVNTEENPIVWNIGDILPSTSVTVSITLQVNEGQPNGTVLQNSLAVLYTVGGSTFTVTTNTPSAAIGVLRGVEISPLNFSATQEPEDTLFYPFTVQNTGNAKDVLEMEYSSSRSYTWTLFKDVNGNGTFDPGDPELTNSNGSGGVDVDSVNAYDSVKVIARLIVPMVAEDQTEDITAFVVKSSSDGTKYQSANGTTTINIASVALSRSVTPSGDQQPGTVMTFTVTYQNNGHGKAYNVVISESEAENMTYVPNSVLMNDLAKTDAADGDEVTVTAVDGQKIITITIGTLQGLSDVGTITYSSTID